MREQILRQIVVIRGTNLIDSVQNDDNGKTSSSFDTTTPFLRNRLVNFASVKTRDEEIFMEIDHAMNNKCVNCTKTGHTARFYPQNKCK